MKQPSSDTEVVMSSTVEVVIPRSPRQAKGLLLSSIRDPNPVVFFEPKMLYRLDVEGVPEHDYMLSLSEAEVIRQGTDITLVGWEAQISVLEQACDDAAKTFQGRSAQNAQAKSQISHSCIYCFLPIPTKKKDKKKEKGTRERKKIKKSEMKRKRER